MAVFAVILDSCVLYPMYLRDTLLCAAEAGLYQPHWTEEILKGAFRNLIKDERITHQKADSLEKLLNKAFPEAMIQITPKLIPCMDNHEGDRHVLAAALIAKAQVIVTDNLKHFPASSLTQFRIEAQSADTFLTSLFDLSPETMVNVLRTQVKGKTKPKLTVLDLLDLLKHQTPTLVQRYQTSNLIN
ncbi:PIN domain-containing protein [Crocosphaera sp. XPORK-15E]|uniref:PIN domain-containing protein n=1 Tax=Crocosphaera sp. XPORK-15E TaxID=3110247 RepID=UPI002B200E8F|nr:PIN domain-containing protein [Crocosphaera sp. XPORK-15E]MEA5537349.1 PIN domain-containing protein [Crocosphaera sp. XPORK-15E]